MRVKVKVEFRDKGNFSRMYNPGEVVSFDKDRAERIISLGLADAIETEEKPKRKKK